MKNEILWIKCSDRLPTQGQRVFISTDGDLNIAHIDEAHIGNERVWVIHDFNYYYFDLEKVTFWALIPAPPEDNSEMP